MQIKGIKELNLLFNLYFCEYDNKKVVGTIPDIVRSINNSSVDSYALNLVRSLINLKIIESVGTQMFKGKIYNTYFVNKKRFIDYFKEVEEFKKSYMVIRDIILSNKISIISPEIYSRDYLKTFGKELFSKSLNI